MFIKISIDLNKIDKTRIKAGKNGAKYYDMIVKDNPKTEYSQYLVVDDQTKEERSEGKKSTILGNGKDIGRGASQSQSQKSANSYELGNDDLPY